MSVLPMSKARSRKRTVARDPRLAVAYIRVSTERQSRTATEEGGFSYQGQEEQVRAWARSHGLTLERVVGEIGSASNEGQTIYEEDRTITVAARPEWQRLLHQLAQPDCNVGVLVIQDLDRTSRNLRDDAALQDLILRLGVTVHEIRRGEQAILNAETWEREAMAVELRQMIARDERRKRSQRVRDGIESKARLGLFVGNVPPVGYRWKAIDGVRKSSRTLEVDPAVAPQIAELFRAAASGRYSWAALHEQAQRLGIVAQHVTSHSSIQQIIRNPIYIGGFRRQGKCYYDGANPVIVDRPLFFAAQETMEAQRVCSRPRGRGREHIFSGFLRCTCGRRLIPKTKKGKRAMRWSCRGTADACGRVMSERRIEEAIAEQLDAVSLTADLAEHFAEHLADYLGAEKPQAGKDAIAKELAEVGKQIARLRARVVDEDFDDETLMLVKSKLHAAVERQRQLAAEHELAEREQATAAHDVESVRFLLRSATSMGQRWFQLDTAERIEFLRRVLHTPKGDDLALPVEVDFDAGSVALRLRPAWQAISKLAEAQRRAARTGRRAPLRVPAPPQVPKRGSGARSARSRPQGGHLASTGESRRSHPPSSRTSGTSLGDRHRGQRRGLTAPSHAARVDGGMVSSPSQDAPAPLLTVGRAGRLAPVEPPR